MHYFKFITFYAIILSVVLFIMSVVPKLTWVTTTHVPNSLLFLAQQGAAIFYLTKSHKIQDSDPQILQDGST